MAPSLNPADIRTIGPIHTSATLEESRPFAIVAALVSLIRTGQVPQTFRARRSSHVVRERRRPRTACRSWFLASAEDGKREGSGAVGNGAVADAASIRGQSL